MTSRIPGICSSRASDPTDPGQGRLEWSPDDLGSPREEPDLIILDVMLPDVNGFERSRNATAGPGTPRVLFPREGQTEDKITGLNARSDHYVTAPSASTRSSPASRRSCAAPCRPTRSASSAPVSSPWTRTRTTCSWRSVDRSEPDGAEAAPLSDAQPRPRAVEGPDPQPRTGVRLQRRRGDRGEAHLVSAAEDQPRSTEPLIQTKRRLGYMLKAGKTARRGP